MYLCVRVFVCVRARAFVFQRYQACMKTQGVCVCCKIHKRFVTLRSWIQFDDRNICLVAGENRILLFRICSTVQKLEIIIGPFNSKDMWKASVNNSLYLYAYGSDTHTYTYQLSFAIIHWTTHCVLLCMLVNMINSFFLHCFFFFILVVFQTFV